MVAGSIELPPTADAARLARRVTVSTLTELGCCGDTLDIAQLLVSELVTNSYRHAATTSQLRLVHEGPDLVVEVEDADPRPPRVLQPEHDALGGRGLALVDSLSAGWGVNPVVDGDNRPVGKVVWFRLPC
jgi:anti-sigma regulatory factor (Ser/Thr protein kinase)